MLVSYACLYLCRLPTVDAPILDSPLYRNPESTIVSFFLEPRAERDRLCNLYEEIVKKLDHDNYNCLLHGTRLRDALAWIELDGNEDNDGSEEPSSIRSLNSVIAAPSRVITFDSLHLLSEKLRILISLLFTYSAWLYYSDS
ncbi:hypothetical protein K438DRAFT_1973161 [Mycena galopus ATCC 62051]|nr:hypothetical protein K438DRAFT_1973161 [Mycena galopus ATCC 62051]